MKTTTTAPKATEATSHALSDVMPSAQRLPQ